MKKLGLHMCPLSLLRKGHISPFDGLTFQNVLDVLKISYNLLSISKIIRHLYCQAVFSSDTVSFRDLSPGKMVGTARYNGKSISLAIMIEGL